MQETVLISMPVGELQKLIIDSVNTCLKYPSEKQLPKEKLLTEKEAATFLNVPLVTIQTLADAAKIPFRLKGKQYYFSKVDLQLWSENNKGGEHGK